MNKLYFADCLEILKELYKQNHNGFIDLIYIDPPFNSKRDYNVLFESVDLSDVKAQKQAFSDTWSNVSYIDTLDEILNLDMDLHSFLKNLDSIKVSKNVVAYLTTMTIRIYYMRKVLKDTGSFYLHCDPTMSHYLKIICDLIFGKKNFRNEIIWSYQRWTNAQNQFQSMHDVIFFYSKTNNNLFNTLMEEYSDKSKHKGKRYSEFVEGKIVQKYTNDESRKKSMRDVWNISYLNSQSKERLGYPTQKPEALLERIIKASSNKGDLIADFFCGCGTTIAVAQKLKRQWLGVDISHLAIKLILDRLTKGQTSHRANIIKEKIVVDGFPKDIASARMLASEVHGGRLKFQDWIIEVMLGGISNEKKTADGGFDGYLTFSKTDKEKGIIIIEVKSGNININNIRGFIQVVDKQKSDLGVFVCFDKYKSSGMENMAKQQGYFECPLFPNRFEKIQIITVEDLLEGKEIHLPYEIYKRTTFSSSKNQLTTEDDIEDTSLFEDTE